MGSLEGRLLVFCIYTLLVAMRRQLVSETQLNHALFFCEVGLDFVLNPWERDKENAGKEKDDFLVRCDTNRLSWLANIKRGRAEELQRRLAASVQSAVDDGRAFFASGAERATYALLGQFLQRNQVLNAEYFLQNGSQPYSRAGAEYRVKKAGILLTVLANEATVTPPNG